MTFVPLSSKLIDEGEFQEELEECLRLAQVQCEEYRKRFGDESHNAKFEVAAKITFQIKDVTNGMITIKWGCDVKSAKRPEGASVAIASTDQNGQPALFVKASGSDDNPFQTKFATADGRNIDPATGKADPR